MTLWSKIADRVDLKENVFPTAGRHSLFCAPGRAHSLGGGSPLHSRHGQVLAEGNGFPGDWESEGSSRQSAGATNRKRIEAASWGKQAKKCEARFMYGTRCRISDAHKREGGCAIPGEICKRAFKATGIARFTEAIAEVSR